jgi:hypothetical protein
VTAALAPLGTSLPSLPRRATADETAAGFAALLAALAAPPVLAPATLAPDAAPAEGEGVPAETEAPGKAAEQQPALAAPLAGLGTGAAFSRAPSAADAEVPSDRPARMPRPAPPPRLAAAPASAPPQSPPHLEAGAPAAVAARPTPGSEATSLRAAGGPPSSEPSAPPAPPAAERTEGARVVAARRASRGAFALASEGTPAPAQHERPEARPATADTAHSGAARDAAPPAGFARTPASRPTVTNEPTSPPAREHAAPEPSPAADPALAREAEAKPLRAAETATLREAEDAPLRELDPQGLPEAAAATATAPRVELAPSAPPPAPARVMGVDSPAPLAPPERLDLREHVVLLAEQGGGSARLTLRPPELGEVQLIVRVRGRRVVVHVRAEELGAQQAVLDHRERLGDALAAKDLRMEEFRLGGTGVGSDDAGASGRRGERGAFAPDPHAVFAPGTARSVPNPSGVALRPVAASDRGIDLRV